MRKKQSQHIDIESVMSTNPGLNRLLRIMACRWAGASLATIAAQEGISRQRVHQILASVDLNDSIRSQPSSSPADTGRGASNKQVAQALAVLTHPLAHQLTARQRCALAWRAQGLGSVAIGRRMEVTPQAVIALESSAVAGLERTVFRRQQKEWAEKQGPVAGDWDEKTALHPVDPVAATGNAATMDEYDLGDLSDLLNTLLKPAAALPSSPAPAVPGAPGAEPAKSGRKSSRRKG